MELSAWIYRRQPNVLILIAVETMDGSILRTANHEVFMQLIGCDNDNMFDDTNKLPGYLHAVRSKELCVIISSDETYPSKLAYACCNEILSSFSKRYSIQEILATTRAYAFTEFQPTLNKLCKQYRNVRSDQNLEIVNNEIRQVQNIMADNLSQLSYRGKKIETLVAKTETLVNDATTFRKNTSKLRAPKWCWVVVIVLMVIIFIMRWVL